MKNNFIVIAFAIAGAMIGGLAGKFIARCGMG